MIHANRIVTVGEQESIIDRPIVLYRGDREVEIEFTLVGNEFTFSEEGNVIKSVNASHGQLVLNTPSGEHMFSELAECHEGKVVFVVTKEMIDEFIEMGFYSFQIRLYDSAEMKSRVTIPPVMNGFDIRNPIAAEDETNVVDQGIVDYARIFKDQSNEELPTFTWDGEYVKTEWVHHDVITENKLNKIEDALYSINANVKESDVVMLNTLDQVKKDADKYVKDHMAEVEADVDEFERNINTDVQQFKIDTNAAMTAHKNEVSEELESVNSKLEHIENVKTVQDLKNIDLKLNTIIQTCGYYEVNDGGANTYIVIPSKEHSYDIECKEYSIRPIAKSDTVCPKQFGTVNDGVNGDNIGLQACFDFVRDYNIGVIDGRNLLYTTDSSTRTHHDHYGVLIHGGVTLRNYRGQVADNVSDMTSILDIIQIEGKHYLIENCEFNGKYGVVAQSTKAAEDGGRHCICFYGKDGKFPKDYIPCGNITIRNCTFNKPDAYGIFISPCDCIYTVENCTFDVNGPAILTYATTFKAQNLKCTLSKSYKPMVMNMLHDEMEMGGNYEGTKLKSLYIDNCDFVCTIPSSFGSIFKLHGSVQGGANYDKIIITNSTTSDYILTMYQTLKNTSVNYIELNNCKGVTTSNGRGYCNFTILSLYGVNVDKVYLNNVIDRFEVDNSIVNTFLIENFTFKKNSSLYINNDGFINNVILNNCKAIDTLNDYFCGLRSTTPGSTYRKIKNLYVNNFEWYNSSRFIEIGVDNIYIDNLHLYGDTVTVFDFIYNRNPNGASKYIIKNSVFEIPNSNWDYLAKNEHVSSGNFIVKDCVYTTLLNILANGMNVKRINCINLNDQ